MQTSVAPVAHAWVIMTSGFLISGDMILPSRMPDVSNNVVGILLALNRMADNAGIGGPAEGSSF